MNFAGRNIVLAWLVAGILVLVIIAAIERVNRFMLMERLQGVDTLFVGSSLMSYAFPKLVVPQSLSEIDGKQALRFGLVSANEYDILKLASIAMDTGVKTVFIETNPIITKKRIDKSGCGFKTKINKTLKDVKFIITSFLLGRKVLDGMWLALKSGIPPLNIKTVLNSYPLRFEKPCELDRWKSIFQSQQTDFFLIMMPRNTTIMQSIGGQSLKSLKDRSVEFSNRFNVPLFIPDVAGDWGMEFFLDHVHLNSAGNQKFMNKLDLWWTENQ